MSYESPIEINYGEMQTEYENGILKAVWKYDIHCNKGELIKALAYDRDQYRKGYEDAKPRWIPCSERLPDPGEYYLVTMQFLGWNCAEYREIDIAKYDFDGWHKANTVLAWCELPEPWKGEQNDSR